MLTSKFGMITLIELVTWTRKLNIFITVVIQGEW